MLKSKKAAKGGFFGCENGNADKIKNRQNFSFADFYFKNFFILSLQTKKYLRAVSV